MNVSTLNWPAIVVAALAGFGLGGLWYSPVLFGRAWSKENGFEAYKGNAAKIYGFTAFFLVLMSFNLAMFLNDPKTTASWGATAGFLAGLWTFSAIAVMSLFELKSWKLIFINGGYSLVSLTGMGAILGAWR